MQANTVPINEFDRSKALAALGFDDSMFVDFCILCGCDYAGTIRGIGPIRALQLIQVGGTHTQGGLRAHRRTAHTRLTACSRVIETRGTACSQVKQTGASNIRLLLLGTSWAHACKQG